MKTEKYNVTGMTCAACQANVTRCVQKLDGVEDVNVSLLANQMTVSYDEAQVHPEEHHAAVQKIGYGAALPRQSGAKESGFRSEWQARKDRAEEGRKSMKHRLVTSVDSTDPTDVCRHGADDGAAGAGASGGDGEHPDFRAGPVGAYSADTGHQPAFLCQRIPSLFHRAPNMDSLVAIGSGAAMFTACLPCSAWPMGSDTGIWRWCTNTPTPSILNPPP